MKIWIHKYGWVSEKAQNKIRDLRPGQVKSIAVIKHAALGDLLMTRPFLITLKQHFPNAQITFSAASHYQKGLPEDLIDHLHISFGKNERGKPLRSALQNYKALGPHDLLFDLTANARSLWTTFLNEAILKIGFVPKGGHKYVYKFLYDVAVVRTNFKFEAEVFLDQLYALGLEPQWPLRFDLEKGEKIIGGKYILYFPTASDAYKCWPEAHFTQLIEKMIKRYGSHQHIILSGLNDWEKEKAGRVAESLRVLPEVRLFRESAKTFEAVCHADLLIGNDTGIRNYAIAAGVPTVGIFFSTVPWNYLPRFGHHRAIFEADGGVPAVEKVFRAACEIMDREKILT